MLNQSRHLAITLIAVFFGKNGLSNLILHARCSHRGLRGRGVAATSSEKQVLKFGGVNRVLGESHRSILSIQIHYGLIVQLSTRILLFLTNNGNTS